MRLNYAIIFVGDMKRSVTFYRDVVGLALKFESPEWSASAWKTSGFRIPRTAEP